MSDYQKILKAIGNELMDVPATQVINKLQTICATLDGIREYYHKDAVFAAFGIYEKEED